MPTGTRPLPGPLSLEVAALLSGAIRSRGVAQTAVADAAGMSASQLSRTLSGQKVFTLDQLDAVCEALALNIADVITTANAAVREASQAAARVVPLRRDVGGRPHTDLETVELDTTQLAASTDNTPIDPSRGEG